MTEKSAKHYQLNVPRSPMRVAPDHAAECSNECLYGERFVIASPGSTPKYPWAHRDLLSEPDNQGSQWMFVIAQRDSYTGYVEKNHLQAVNSRGTLPTHWVHARSTLIFSQPSIKSQVLNRLPFLSRVTSQAEVQPPFRALTTGGYVWDQHLLKTDQSIDVTPLQLALSHFLGAPYLWGGCTPEGLDCSGLIQALALAKGLSIPRDSKDQEYQLKHSVAIGSKKTQDIIYWPGHTGILVDPETLLHATAHSLSCVIEPLDTVIERAGQISSVKRLF
ncbi:MAG: NlpC/P60 family protein [Granulosicoccus sp.]